MTEIEECSSWSELLRQIINIPIKRFPDEAYSDDDIRTILTTMRTRTDEANANPDAEDPYETRGKDYGEMQEIFEKMADYRGIVIHDDKGEKD